MRFTLTRRAHYSFLSTDCQIVHGRIMAFHFPDFLAFKKIPDSHCPVISIKVLILKFPQKSGSYKVPEQVTNSCLRAKPTPRTKLSWPFKLPIQANSPTSHKRMVLSPLHDANIRPEGGNATPFTHCVCPFNEAWHWPVRMSHNRTAQSTPQ